MGGFFFFSIFVIYNKLQFFMQKSEPSFSRQNLKSLLVYVAINMVIATIFYFAFSYNIYIPMIAGAFGGFCGDQFFGKKVEKQ